MREFVIGDRRIADDTACYVIAELGNTHNGSVDLAGELILEAAKAGVDAVKFQKKDIDRLYTSALLNKSYDNEVSFGATYGAHKRALELTPSQLSGCFVAAADLGLHAFATPFDERSVDVLEALDVPCYKVHSGGLTDQPLIRAVAATGKPVICSTGGATLKDIDQAHAWLADVPHAFLHCTASYPLKSEDANLRAILTLRTRYPETVIGFSSHSPGIAFSLVAYALGARILEHHVTLSRAMKGTDHGFSLEPKGLQTLVDDLGKLRVALGDGVKIPKPGELTALAKLRRTSTTEGWRIAG